MSRGFKVEGKNGDFKIIPVDILDKDGEIDWDKVIEENIVVLEDSEDTIYVLEYNGREIMTTPRMTEIEEEDEDVVVDALKRDGVFSEIEYSDDPDDDDELVEFRLFTLKV